jgi:thiamine biosynthesis lipoprotein
MTAFLSAFKFSPLLLILWWCQSGAGQSQPSEWKLNGYAQGTTYSIIYFKDKEVVKGAQIDSLLDDIDQSMSLYKDGSLINKFNGAVSGVQMDQHFRKVIKKSLDVYKASGGLFDVTVEPLVQAWGFGAHKVDSLPTPSEIRGIMKFVGSDKIYLRGNYLYKRDKRVKIDLNGIAQGYSVDVLADFLESRGIGNYMVELGGEIRVKGHKLPGMQKFTLGIQAPGNGFNEDLMQKVIELDSGGLTTSGNYRKFYMSKHNRVSHLINPKTGYSLQNEMISATVWARNAITADGYDNVFMAMGVKKSLAFVKHHPGIEIYLIYQKADGSVADTASAGFYKFVKKN